MLSDVVSPLPAQSDGNIQPTYAGDYDYGSALLTKHITSWTDGRVAISAASQQDTFTDRELVGFAVTTTTPACNSIIRYSAGGLCYQSERPGEYGNGPGKRFHGQRNSGEHLSPIRNGNATITFHFNTSPVTTQGPQTMHIPANAFNSRFRRHGELRVQLHILLCHNAVNGDLD